MLYKIYGLIIQSEINFQGLKVITNGNPDVYIAYGRVPEKIDGKQVGMSAFASPTEFLFDVPGIARYWVKNPSQVIIEKYSGMEDQDVKPFLLNAVFTYLLVCRDYLVLDGSNVVINGKNVILCGSSGAGKSALAATFMQNGHYVVSDELTVIQNIGGKLNQVTSSLPIKVWKDVCIGLNIEHKDLTQVRSSLSKYELPLSNFNENIRAPISHIYHINIHNQEQLLFEPKTHLEKISTLVPCTAYYPLIKAIGKSAIQLKLSMALAAQVKIIKITRPQRYSLKKIIKNIMEDLDK